MGGYHGFTIEKECEICGKTFVARSAKAKFCNEIHLKECEICFSQFQVKSKQFNKVKTCSTECRKKITEKTNLEKYGVKFVTQNEQIKEKTKKTNLERYGAENVLSKQSNLRESVEQTWLEKYGVSSPLASKVIQEKIKTTNLERYGVENPGGLFKEKIQNTTMKKYGVEWSGKLDKIKKINSKRLTNFEIQKNMNKKLKLTKSLYSTLQNENDWLNLKDYLLENKNKSLVDLLQYFNLNNIFLYSLKRKIKKLQMEDFVVDFYRTSQKELEFLNFFKEENITGFERNNRTVLKPFELDFYFPKEKLAIEISPSFTHKLKDNDFIGVSNKNYHHEKFKRCSEQGIELITVFDWHDRTKIFNFIKNKLNKNNSTIFARNCYIEELSEVKKIHKLFLENNHVLGSVNNKKNSIVIELKNDNLLVGLGVFYFIKENSYELKRLAFAHGINIPGGASKIIQNFIKKHQEVENIITFSDNDLGTGNVYKKLGFKLIQEVSNSLNFWHEGQKKHIKNVSLVKQGADRLLKNFPNYQSVGLGENLPKNQEIVLNYGFLPVYDSGYRKWIYSTDK